MRACQQGLKNPYRLNSSQLSSDCVDGSFASTKRTSKLSSVEKRKIKRRKRDKKRRLSEQSK